ncbi:MAG TPA: UDP-N-acetylmuramoyl-tripeptide--D-alanyl-D-alanine ligase [Oxalicibacterium sp.]|uniref:UDP-N-acetylmuramoyl-tripeptide--D-alanyl-D- alanine ligase n=1 Tax=Oxalicibacterium sp. TaxID=2766525 RepID=UPI002CA210A5|nr:UDP-N-acetylmuramoyl-tripeptide--D-alanyl-D-alanine ligase [Oxalicibacterium sp.]HWU98935.1 UDP-N-acetylmuramoyl-tripeptide--D-alanyl-D-alanine ligase [Oxalicibacterium sp.]
MKSSLAVLQTVVRGASMKIDAAFDGVSTDSRNLSSGNLFVALRGERFDAHDFLPQVSEHKVAAVVAEKIPQGFNVPALVVPDTRIALGEIAHYWRERFDLPLIGVTGSNGKTTVKEMIAAVLDAAFGTNNYLATRGNFNNDIGVPLTLMRLNDACKAAVVELGMNHPGEIDVLSQIAQPTVGLVNNAQREHQEFMTSVEAVAMENGTVLRNLPASGTAVFPADDPYTSLWRGYAEHCKVMTFGLSDDADVRCTHVANVFGSDLQITASGRQFAIRLNAAGLHNVRNALAAIACTLAIGIPVEAIVNGLQAFAPFNGRLQRKLAVNGAQVIDDTYNANPDSVRAAIDVLAQTAAPRILVLGDMGEVGNDGRQYHEEVGAYAHACGVDRVLTLGELARHTSDAFGAQAVHCNNVEQLNEALDAFINSTATVLVKGSRFMKMERVVQHLLGQQIQEGH